MRLTIVDPYDRHIAFPPFVVQSDNIFVSWDNHRKPRRLHIGDFDTSKILDTTGAKTFTQVGTRTCTPPAITSSSPEARAAKKVESR